MTILTIIKIVSTIRLVADELPGIMDFLLKIFRKIQLAKVASQDATGSTEPVDIPTSLLGGKSE